MKSLPRYTKTVALMAALIFSAGMSYADEPTPQPVEKPKAPAVTTTDQWEDGNVDDASRDKDRVNNPTKPAPPQVADPDHKTEGTLTLCPCPKKNPVERTPVDVRIAPRPANDQNDWDSFTRPPTRTIRQNTVVRDRDDDPKLKLDVKLDGSNGWLGQLLAGLLGNHNQAPLGPRRLFGPPSYYQRPNIFAQPNYNFLGAPNVIGQQPNRWSNALGAPNVIGLNQGQYNLNNQWSTNNQWNPNNQWNANSQWTGLANPNFPPSVIPNYNANYNSTFTNGYFTGGQIYNANLTGPPPNIIQMR